MACSCGSERIVTAGGKCSDMSTVYIGRKRHEGELPSDMGIGGGDYFRFKYCLDCGKIQGLFPLPTTELENK